MKNLLLVLFTLFYISSEAQLNPKIYMLATDLPKLPERVLVVALQEEDPEELKIMQKKFKKEPQLLERYKAEIKSYNDHIKSAVGSIWKINEQIEYKPITEVQELMKTEKTKKGKEYMVLMPAHLEGSMVKDRSDVSVKALIYTRAENDLIKPDYKIYIPNSDMRDTKENTSSIFAMSGINKLYSPFMEMDLHLAVNSMHNNIQHMIEKKAVVPFDKYLTAMVKNNCGQQNGKTVLIDSLLLYGKDYKDINKVFSEVKDVKYELVSTEDVNKAYMDGLDNTLVAVSTPYGVIPGGNFETRAAGKILVDCKTKQFIAEHEWLNPIKGGKINVVLFREKDLKQLATCPVPKK